MVCKHAYLNTFVLLHSAFLLRVKMLLTKGRLEAVHEIVMEITFLIMENHGIVFFNFCGNLEFGVIQVLRCNTVESDTSLE